MNDLIEEKLGYDLPISYEDWLSCCHFQEIESPETKWLYEMEMRFADCLKNVTLKEIAEQRIEEFTTALRKYIL